MLKQRGGYVYRRRHRRQAGNAESRRDALAKFSREHWHDEDEVRFIVEAGPVSHPSGQRSGVRARGGSGRFDPRAARYASLVRSLRRPPHPRQVRVFQDVSGWTPHYTESGVDKDSSRSASGRPTCRAERVSAERTSLPGAGPGGPASAACRGVRGGAKPPWWLVILLDIRRDDDPDHLRHRDARPVRAHLPAAVSRSAGRYARRPARRRALARGVRRGSRRRRCRARLVPARLP